METPRPWFPKVPLTALACAGLPFFSSSLGLHGQLRLVRTRAPPCLCPLGKDGRRTTSSPALGWRGSFLLWKTLRDAGKARNSPVMAKVVSEEKQLLFLWIWHLIPVPGPKPSHMPTYGPESRESPLCVVPRGEKRSLTEYYPVGTMTEIIPHRALSGADISWDTGTW